MAKKIAKNKSSVARTTKSTPKKTSNASSLVDEAKAAIAKSKAKKKEDEVEGIKKGDIVIIETDYGPHKGKVTGPHHIHDHLVYVEGIGDPVEKDRLKRFENGGEIMPWKKKDKYELHDLAGYADTEGQFTKIGRIDKVYEQDGKTLYHIKDGGSYLADELRPVSGYDQDRYRHTMAMVEVEFENPEYNYETNINGDEENARKYFVGKYFNLGSGSKDDMQKCIGIKFHEKGTYAKGGEIENQYNGLTQEEVWARWSKDQQKHFVEDHKEYLSKEDIASIDYNAPFSNLPLSVNRALTEHVKKGEYKKGGVIQNPPQGDSYTQERDKSRTAKPAGWRFTNEGADRLGVSKDKRPTAAQVEKYKGKEFKVKGKIARYLYEEERIDKSDMSRKAKFEKGGEINEEYAASINYWIKKYEEEINSGITTKSELIAKNKEELAELNKTPDDERFGNFDKRIAIYEAMLDHFEENNKIPLNFGSAENINVFGYQTKFFINSPIAVDEFIKAMDIIETKFNDSATSAGIYEHMKDSLKYMAQLLDGILKTEDDVLTIGTPITEELVKRLTEDIQLVGVYNYRSGFFIKNISFIGDIVFNIVSCHEKPVVEVIEEPVVVIEPEVIEPVIEEDIIDVPEEPEYSEEKTEEFAKGGQIECENSNLYIIGSGHDTNGNHVIKVKYPNSSAFSIQTGGGGLSEANSLRGKNAVKEASPEKIDAIEKELVSYIEQYGSKKQKQGLHVYDKDEAVEKSTKFKDKVNAIEKSLEGKKVPKKYQNTEGKVFTKATATKAAKKIAGKIAKEGKK